MPSEKDPSVQEIFKKNLNLGPQPNSKPCAIISTRVFTLKLNMSGLFFRFKQIVSYLFSFKPLAFVSAICLSTMGLAQEIKSGEQVSKEVCFTCHAAGAQNAPKFGDKAAWPSLLKEGQQVVTAHGWVGQGGMPPRGGKPDLSLEEFARASGGNWKNPDAAMLDRIRNEEKKRIEELKAKK